jgi:O-antigen ligase
VAVNVLRTRRRQHVVLGAITGTALLLTLIGLVLMVRPSTRDLALTLQRPEQYHGRMGASYVCPNHYAGLLEMTLPLVLAAIMVSKARLPFKLLAGIAGLLLLVGLILSMSRGAWLSLVIGIGVLLALGTWQKRINLLAWLIPLIIIVAAVGAIVVNSRSVRERFGSLPDAQDKSYAARAIVWKHTLDVIKGHALFGTGPGTYRWAFKRVQPAGLEADVRYAHNDYLHTLSDYGLVGLGLVLWAVGAFAYRGVRALRRAKKSSDLALGIGVLAAATAIAAHSFVDFNMRIPANLVTMLVLGAALIAMRQYQLRRLGELVIFKRSDTRRLHAGVKIAAVAVLVLAAAAILVLNGRKHEARIAYHRGLELDMTRPQPMLYKERVRRAIVGARALTERHRDEILEELRKMDRPTPWEIEREVAGLISSLQLDKEEAAALDSAARHARDITAEQRGQIVAAYVRALRLDPENYEFDEALLGYHLYAGQNELLNHRAVNELAQALPYGRRAVALNPLSAEAAFETAETCRHMFDRLTREDRLNLIDRSAYKPVDWYEDQARHWYQAAIGLYPENGVYREGYGKFLMLAGDLRSARAQFEKGVEIFVDKPWFQEPFKRKLEQIEQRLRRERLTPSADGAGDGTAPPPSGGTP